jgi:RNA polymerase sigma-70 factor (ECF subfamily)|tara:strand:- start:913 stop:1443 length:531 start_codon:yes stop_codon:yes gene_type:complete
MHENHTALELSEEFVMELTQAQERLFGFLFKRLAKRDQAQDVLQLTNLVICRKAGDYQQGTSFISWAYTIANYQLLAYRKEQSRDRLVFSDKTLELIDDNQEHKKSSRHHEELRLCLGRLAKPARDLLAQRYDENLSIQQISLALGKTVNAVRLKLHRLRIELMKCIEKRLKEESA